MKITLLNRIWWKAALIRALRTAIVIAAPYFATATLIAHVSWIGAASSAGLGFILSLATSLAGITEASGITVPVWYALLERAVKTFAQAFVAGIGNAVLFSDVHWLIILQNAVIAAIGSLLLGFLSTLPGTTALGVTPPKSAVIGSGPAH